jgi:DNA (cytosine-5)-methyltransferase 1
LNEPYRVLDLFSGIGGFSLGLERTGGFRTVAFCESDPYCRAVLARHWTGVPIYEDARSLTAGRLRAEGIVPDLICGGFPCQDASIARTQWGERAGIDGGRTGLWGEIARLAADFRQAILLLENVPGLLSAGFGRVLGDLASLGFDAEWRCLSALRAGLPHIRDRVWVVAYPRGSGLSRPYEGRSLLESVESQLAFVGNEAASAWRSLERDLENIRGGDGVSLAMERRRLKPLGNAVVPIIPEAIGRAILQAEGRLT